MFVYPLVFFSQNNYNIYVSFLYGYGINSTEFGGFSHALNPPPARKFRLIALLLCMAVMTLTSACALAGTITVGSTTHDNLAAAAKAAHDSGNPVIISGTVNLGYEAFNPGLNVTFEGAKDGGTIYIKGDSNLTPGSTGGKFTFKNLTLEHQNSNYGGFAQISSVRYEDCTFVGEFYNYPATANFVNCTFSQTEDWYNIWTYGAKNITFEKCTFSSSRKFVLVYNESNQLETNATFNNCSFIANDKYPAGGKADRGAVESHPDWLAAGKKYTVNMNNCGVDCRIPAAFRDNHAADGAYNTPSGGSVFNPVNVNPIHIDDDCGHPRDVVAGTVAPSMPQTGDSSSLMLWASVMVLCAAAFAMLSRKRASN